MTTLRSHVLRLMVCLALFGGALNAFQYFSGLMGGPAKSVDELVVQHQWRMSLQPPPVDLIFTGDSSCLMDLSVPELERALTNRLHAVNLGTMSFLPVSFFGTLAANALARGNKQAVVVLLVNPELLVTPRSPELNQFAHNLIARTTRPKSLNFSFRSMSGAAALEDLLLSRLAPTPLSKEHTQSHALNWSLTSALSRSKGSMAEPRPLLENPERRGYGELAEDVRLEAKRFKNLLGSNVTLLIGLTPVPEEGTGPAFASEHEKLLQELCDLTGGAPLPLPAVYPARDFGTRTHLNRFGQARFSRAVAKALLPAIKHER